MSLLKGAVLNHFGRVTGYMYMYLAYMIIQMNLANIVGLNFITVVIYINCYYRLYAQKEVFWQLHNYSWSDKL